MFRQEERFRLKSLDGELVFDFVPSAPRYTMAMELPRMTLFVEESLQRANQQEAGKEFDDDGRIKRRGTWMSASAHIITAVIGSGVLTLSWAVAQLGWIFGFTSLFAFSFVTAFCSRLLADCYRFPGPVTGTRNYTYMDVVKTHLGGINYKLCGLAQYVNLVGFTIGYTITTGVSMAAIKRSSCFHENGHDVPCHVSANMYMVVYMGIQIILSQLPDFHKISWLSLLAAVMSFGYASIGLGLSIGMIAEKNHDVRTSLTGVTVGVDVSGTEKLWRSFQALGNIAFAYAYSNVLIEIQDTLKSSPPENQVMKRASMVGVSTTTFFYMMCGILGYAAFGNDAPGNFLTGFGFYEPFWLVDIGNICIVIHLIGAYQVFCQPLYQFVENWSYRQWPQNTFIRHEINIKVPFYGNYPFNFFKVTWRSGYVIVTTVVAMIFPFFNDILGLLGAVAFWPLTVYFPVKLYIVQAKIPQFSASWLGLNILVWTCLVVSLLAACGSIYGLVQSLKTYKPFVT